MLVSCFADPPGTVHNGERGNSLKNRKSSLWLAIAKALRETDAFKGKFFPIRTLRSIDQYCKSKISPDSFT